MTADLVLTVTSGSGVPPRATWASREDALPAPIVLGTCVQGNPPESPTSTHGQWPLLPGRCLLVLSGERVLSGLLGTLRCRVWSSVGAAMTRLLSPQLPGLHGSRAEATAPSPTPPQHPGLRPAPALLTCAVGRSRHGMPSIPPPARSQLWRAGPAQRPFDHACGVLAVGGPSGTGGPLTFPWDTSFLPAHEAGASRWVLKAPHVVFSQGSGTETHVAFSSSQDASLVRLGSHPLASLNLSCLLKAPSANHVGD